MPRRNRVDPWGDLHAVAARGLFTGNRGCLVDDAGEVVRHHGSRAVDHVPLVVPWMAPSAGRAAPLDPALLPRRRRRPGRRAIGRARRAAGPTTSAYRDAVSTELGAAEPLLAKQLDGRLVAERHRRGRGFARAGDRLTWTAGPPTTPGRHRDRGRERASAGPRRSQLGVRLRWLARRCAASGRRGDRPHTADVSRRARGGFVPTLHPSVE